jgi:Rps23 Pro-64 3,4-dihydroxylase Tpa1-like proline 4-hydroxylase
VSPVGGTLVLFDSRYLLHEVEPSHRDRLALTLWVVGDKKL